MDETLKALGGSTPAPSKDIVFFSTPDIAENGAVVPIGITSSIPKTESIAILIEKNPNMLAAVFDIPAGHRSVAVDARQDGPDVERLRAREGRRQVLRGDEGNQGHARRLRRLTPRRARGAAMADPMKIRANLVGDSTEVKVLMNHEMETGQRKDAQGKTIPAWFIQNVTATHERQDGARGAVGTGGGEEPVPVVQVQGRRQGRQGADHLDRQPRRQAHGRGDDRVSRGMRTASMLAHVRCAVVAATALAAVVRAARSPNRRSTRSPSTARRCRTAIPPSCGKRAARRCGRSRAVRSRCRSPRATSASAPASSRARTRSCRATSPTPTA